MITIHFSTLIFGGAIVALVLIALSALIWMQGYGAGERDKAQEKDRETAELRDLLTIAEEVRDKLILENATLLKERNDALDEARDAEAYATTLRADVEKTQVDLATVRGQLAFTKAKLESWADPKASKTVKAVLGSGPYIVLPSLAFDVLPVELRNRLTAVLQEAEDMGVNWPAGYVVVRRGAKGRAAVDLWKCWYRPGADELDFEQANGGPLKAGAGDQP